jgi:hypothetical protein
MIIKKQQMKNLLIKKHIQLNQWPHSITTIQKLTVKNSPLPIVLISLLLFGCMKQGSNENKTSPQPNKIITESTDLNTIYTSKDLSPETLNELKQVKAATGKYSNLDNAFKDDYKDIGLKMENMGYHFLKSNLVSTTFDLSKPAILVYNKRNNGSFELVAVEYAVPIDPQSPHTPPEGFTGDADEWDFNTLNTGWWTLHAWVWNFNPDGVFKPMNPLVIVK